VFGDGVESVTPAGDELVLVADVADGLVVVHAARISAPAVNTASPVAPNRRRRLREPRPEPSFGASVDLTCPLMLSPRFSMGVPTFTGEYGGSLRAG
jgi:hypothetical protein